MLYYLIAIIAAAVDQIIKQQIVQNVIPVGKITVIKDFFHITYVENYGIAFGMFQNKATFFIITTAIISIVVIYLINKVRKESKYAALCLSAILGGAIGNLIDRIRLGYVIDYLQFTIFPPVFNFADSCIVVGAIILSLLLLVDKNINI